MLVISSKQMMELSEALEGRFVRQCNAMLRADYPEFSASKSEEDLSAFVRNGIKSARKYKIKDRDDVRNFLRYQSAFGSDFEEQERFVSLKKVLLTRNFSGSEKISRMLEKQKPENPK